MQRNQTRVALVTHGRSRRRRAARAMRAHRVFGISVVLVLCCAGCAKKPPSSITPQEHTRPSRSFVALDYEKPGHPYLTPDNVRELQDVLLAVKWCQRSLVRYAFPNGNAEIAIFFDPKSLNGMAHIFGQGNFYYLPAEDTVVVPPPDFTNIDSKEAIAEGVKWDIDHQPCPASPEP